MPQTTASRETQSRAFVVSVHGVRYQVKDVARSVAFYTTHLGFTLEHQQLPRLRASLWVTRRFCSAVRKRLVHVQCRTDSVRSPAAGIVWC